MAMTTLHRLTSFSLPADNATQSVAYDLNGNLTSRTTNNSTLTSAKVPPLNLNHRVSRSPWQGLVHDETARGVEQRRFAYAGEYASIFCIAA